MVSASQTLASFSRATAFWMICFACPIVVGASTTTCLSIHAPIDGNIGQQELAVWRSDVTETLTGQLGNAVKVYALPIPSMQQWLDDHDVSELTPATCLRLGCRPTEKTIVLSVRRRNGAIRIRGIEFDAPYNRLSPCETGDVLQRDLFLDTISEIVGRLWTPIVTILSNQNSHFRVLFPHPIPGVGITVADAHDPRVFEVWRDRSVSGQWLRQRHDSLILQPLWKQSSLLISGGLGKQQARGAMGVADPAYFAGLDSSGIRYTARLVRPTSQTVELRVWRRGTVKDQPDLLFPAANCDVYVGPLGAVGRPQRDTLVAVSDDDGRARVEPKGSEPILVTVKYENRSLQRLILPGITPLPVDFHFDDVTNHSTYVAALTSVCDQVQDHRKKLNNLLENLGGVAVKGDTQQVEQMTHEVLNQTNINRWISEVDQIVQAARLEGVDLTNLEEKTRSDIHQLLNEVQSKSQQMAEANQQAIAEKKLDVLQKHLSQASWDRLLVGMREFATEFPEHPQSAKLSNLEEAMRDRDDEHATARGYLIAIIEQTEVEGNIEPLIKRWPETKHSIETLLQYEDDVYLHRLNDRIEQWIAWHKQDTESLKKTAGNNATEEQRRRSVRLNEIKDDLSKLVPSIQKAATKARGLLSAPDG